MVDPHYSKKMVLREPVWQQRAEEKKNKERAEREKNKEKRSGTASNNPPGVKDTPCPTCGRPYTKRGILNHMKKCKGKPFIAFKK